MKTLKIIFICGISIFLFSCVIARVSPYPGFNYQESDPTEIQVYYYPPDVQFEIIGEVQGRGAPAASWGSVEWQMKNKAAAIGGDAIIMIERREQYAGTYTTASRGNAFIYGNSVYYTYQPGSSFAMKRKHVIGLVLKWN